MIGLHNSIVLHGLCTKYLGSGRSERCNVVDNFVEVLTSNSVCTVMDSSEQSRKGSTASVSQTIRLPGRESVWTKCYKVSEEQGFAGIVDALSTARHDAAVCLNDAVEQSKLAQDGSGNQETDGIEMEQGTENS